MHEFGAELGRHIEACHAARPHAAADALARFEHEHFAPGTHERVRRREAGRSRADDDYFRRR